MAEEIKKYDMTLPALEIDAALLVAKNAVSYEPQTPTESQQAQARANIGAGPVVIDLDTYGETPISVILFSLLLGNGGIREGVDVGNLFADLNTDRQICVRFSYPAGNDIYLPVTLQSVTTVQQNGRVVMLGITGVVNLNDTVMRVTVTIKVDGVMTMHVEYPGE